MKAVRLLPTTWTSTGSRGGGGGAGAMLTDAEQRHVAACDRCSLLFEGTGAPSIS